MDALVSQVGTWLLAQGAVGILALAALGWGWLERLGRTEERKDRKEAQDKLEASQKQFINDMQAQASKFQDLAEKWAASLDRGGRSR
jgi:hypothetical protein